MSSQHLNESFADCVSILGRRLVLRGQSVQTRTWQAMDVSGKPTMTPIELQNVTIDVAMEPTQELMARQVEPNLPWADKHFMERVGGLPLNPPPSHTEWPFARRGNAEHVDESEQFSHTYPERFWPRMANVGTKRPNGRAVHVPHNGIRYEYGDLGDVVELLIKDRYTRQSYLPVFFPEDTGAVDGQRIPCTLGYQFMVRPGGATGAIDQINLTYHIRSCDFLRHFRDDVYMAMRLALWMKELLPYTGRSLEMGDLVMHMDSLHVFEGDRKLMESRYA